MYSSRALYIGAGLDLRPLKHLQSINEFIYVDSRPYSEFGREIFINKKGENTSYDHTFISDLDDTMKTHKMNLCVVIDNKRVYSDGSKTIIYYVNTSIPEDIDIIKHELNTIDTLIIAGHDPHYELIERFKEPIHFIGFEDTYFDKDPTSDEDELTHCLHRNKYHTKFIDFSYMYFIRYFKMKKQTFSSWNDFVNEHSHFNMCNI